MGRRPALPGLAAAFESLLEQVAPDPARHCARLGFDPLRAALPWMVGGFAGVLEMGQLLLLWDRVIGYDSLLPLAVVAAGVFLFLRNPILVRDGGCELRRFGGIDGRRGRAPGPLLTMPSHPARGGLGLALTRRAFGRLRALAARRRRRRRAG